MLWKCTVCGLIYEGDSAPEKCPKCGAPASKFTSLSKEEADKIYAADRTNDLLMEVEYYAAKIAKLSEEGLEIGLDPGCIASFTGANRRAWDIKQSCKAEIAIHVGKEKF
ncbi:rubredoxin-like domain-containing protein [Anaerovorax odorimutans]|uniref:rubredoxin-like domain-containing protein n=1 Tax=Anaerovorax odorimutans TaxID=109327 RepID=UPI000419D669|nr:rubredoxin [Anaerovorax odorimutans]